MASTPARPPSAMRSGPLEPLRINARIKIAGLWASVLFVFAYVDLFTLYRTDVRADLDAGKVGEFTIGQPFLLLTTIYVALPAVMIVASLALPPRVTRGLNVALAPAYAVTIAAGAIGEWHYYVLGSAVEIAMLAGIAYYAWTWPRQASASM